MEHKRTAMRGRAVRWLLFPHIVRLFLTGLVCGALLLTILLMTRLAIDLMNETNHMNYTQLTTNQVLHYIKHFLILSLFGALQLLGGWAFLSNDDQNTVKWTLFGWCSLVCGTVLLLDAFISHGCLAVGLFVLLQGALVALHNILMPIPASILLSGESTNVHYIQMPPETSILTGRKKPKHLPS